MTLSQSEAFKQVQTLESIPTLPAVMSRILEVLEDERSCAEDITVLLSADPAITLRILRLANSPFFGSRFEIDSIHRAVVTIGFEAVKQLALATSVLGSMGEQKQSSLDPEDFWMHALGSAKAAQLLAFSTRQISVPEACFTGGLVHDMGKIVLALGLQEAYGAVLQQANEENLPLIQVEQQVLQTDHSEVGGWLAQRWSLPEIIVQAVRHSEYPERYEGPYRKEVLIVSLASDLARLADYGSAGDLAEVTLNEGRLAALGLGLEQANALCENLALVKEDGRTLLGLLREG